MAKPKTVKKAAATAAAAGKFRHKMRGPANFCRYCTARLPRGPRKFCNMRHQNAFAA